jgi:hypothetical protein
MSPTQLSNRDPQQHWGRTKRCLQATGLIVFATRKERLLLARLEQRWVTILQLVGRMAHVLIGHR